MILAEDVQAPQWSGPLLMYQAKRGKAGEEESQSRNRREREKDNHREEGADGEGRGQRAKGHGGGACTKVLCRNWLIS